MSAVLTAEFEKRFAGGPRIEGRLSLAADTFSVAVLFGPSGSGKTTVLRCLAGLERPDRGFIRFGDRVWFDAGSKRHLPPQARDVGYLSQDYSLFPHLTVGENIAYGLGGLQAGERSRRIGELIGLLGLNGLERRYPRHISGGQQQRVALARAVARRPALLLLDEPLSALDSPTREPLRGELRRWLRAMGVPALVVTHDRTEALALGDAVVVMDAGRVYQSGPVEEVFSRPASVEVARAVGVETVVAGEVVAVADGLAEVVAGGARLRAPADGAAGKVFVSIRGDDVVLAPPGSPPGSAGTSLTGVTRTLAREGPVVRVVLDCGFPLTALVLRQACSELGLVEGATVTALVKAANVHLIPRP
jgi:molybdate transport system ATP-binding protein